MSSCNSLRVQPSSLHNWSCSLPPKNKNKKICDKNLRIHLPDKIIRSISYLSKILSESRFTSSWAETFVTLDLGLTCSSLFLSVQMNQIVFGILEISSNFGKEENKHLPRLSKETLRQKSIVHRRCEFVHFVPFVYSQRMN